MYNFLYNHFKKQIADKIRLIYTDTDSLIICAVRLNADCIRMVNEEEIKKANGDQNSVVKNI